MFSTRAGWHRRPPALSGAQSGEGLCRRSRLQRPQPLLLGSCDSIEARPMGVRSTRILKRTYHEKQVNLSRARGESSGFHGARSTSFLLWPRCQWPQRLDISVAEGSQLHPFPGKAFGHKKLTHPETSPWPMADGNNGANKAEPSYPIQDNSEGHRALRGIC